MMAISRMALTAMPSVLLLTTCTTDTESELAILQSCRTTHRSEGIDQTPARFALKLAFDDLIYRAKELLLIRAYRLALGIFGPIE